MPRFSIAALIAAASLTPGLTKAQDVSRPVAGAGVSVPGWTGKVDPREAQAGQTINNARFVKEGDALHATTGPQGIFWNLANKASGDYTIKATFKEPKYMALNDHPHPYGIMIGGNDLDSDQASFLYCAAYGNGGFILRGFAPGGTPFQLNGRRGEMHDAVKKAAAPGEPVTQEIAISVKGDKVQCIINGTVVREEPKANVVGAGKLKSTDGLYGIRMGHNTEAVVTGLTMTKP